MRPKLSFALCAALSGVSSAFASEHSHEAKPTSSITVVGTGEVNVKPDLAQINVGVLSTAETAAEALKANNQKMKELFKVLENRGIAEKDIQTSNFSVNPQYATNPQHASPRVIGYQVSNQVQVKVRQLSSLGAVLDELISSGANQLHGINFSLNDPTNHLDDARRKAMADARRKAELYATAARATVGPPLSISEQSGRVVQPYGAMSMQAMRAEAVAVAPGEQTLSASITVTYVLRSGAEKDASDGHE